MQAKTPRMPYVLTRRNRRSPGPEGSFGTLIEAQDAVQRWITLQTYVGDEMAFMAGLEILGPDGQVAWAARK